MTPYTCSAQENSGGQQEKEHGVVHHVQWERYQRKDLRVWVKVIGPVGNPESTLRIPGLVYRSLFHQSFFHFIVLKVTFSTYLPWSWSWNWDYEKKLKSISTHGHCNLVEDALTVVSGLRHELIFSKTLNRCMRPSLFLRCYPCSAVQFLKVVTYAVLTW